MSYLGGMTVAQLDDGVAGRCRAKVTWSYGALLPNVIEITYTSDGSTSGPAMVRRLVVRSASDPVEWEDEFPAPDIGTVSLVPRMLQADGYTSSYYQPDIEGQLRRFDEFIISQRVSFRATEPSPVRVCSVIPVIQSLVATFGEIVVKWTSAEDYDRYDVGWRDGVLSREGSTSDTSFSIERVQGDRSYQVRVRGVQEGLFSDCASDWSDWVDIYVQPKDGFRPVLLNEYASIAALSRDSDYMDIFAIGADGYVRGAWWNGSPWHMWRQIGSRSFPPNAPIGALSRSTNCMDLFVGGHDGRIYSSGWNGNPWSPWGAIGNAYFAPGVHVSPLARNSDFMDIFAVDRFGLVQQAWWNGSPWRPWFPIDGEQFEPGSSVASLSRNDDYMDIFLVGLDGTIRGNWWNGNPWRGWYAIAGSEFPVGAPIAAVSRKDDHMEIWSVGLDGIIRGCSWDGRWGDWYRLDGATFRPMTPIAAVSRNDGHMELLAVNENGVVQGNWWENGSWKGWFQRSADTTTFSTPIAAVSRAEPFLDLFVVSKVPGYEIVWSDSWRYRVWEPWVEIP